MIRASRLFSPPFLALYVAGGAALILNSARHRYGSASWFPVTVGLIAAIAIIALAELFDSFLRSDRVYGRRTVVLFSGLALLTAAAVPFLLRAGSPLAAVLVLGMSLIFGCAAIGTLRAWPGFRPPRNPDFECLQCGYDLTENTSDVCPQCGTRPEEQDI